MSKSKDDAKDPKHLSDKDLDKASGGANSAVREDLEKVIAADELAKLSGGASGDPRQEILEEMARRRKG